jgi:CRP-like cAMP-binding protein
MPIRRQLQRRKPTSPKASGHFDPKAFLGTGGLGRVIHRYRPKQTIFSQGERADAVFYIQEGRVKLSVLSGQGKEATIALLAPDDFLGEGCIVSDQPVRLATATAITDCSVLTIDGATVAAHAPCRTPFLVPVY